MVADMSDVFFFLSWLKKILADMDMDKEVDKLADMVAGYGLIGPKLFRPEPLYPTCVSSIALRVY